jgi:molybdopterin-biosynthesis enzyme MoeA-like protein
MHHLAQELTRIGIDLKEVRVVGDEAAQIVAAVRALSGAYDEVFTSGGIGPTHDDITADCIAEAFGQGISIRDDARKLLTEAYAARGVEVTEARLRMARIPDDAVLIDNPVSTAPGFTVENVHVMAGVPKVFEAMVASVLPELTGGTPLLSQTWRVEMPEGEIAGPLKVLVEEFSDLSFGSYPYSINGVFGANIVVRGTDGPRLDAAMVKLQEVFPNG